MITRSEVDAADIMKPAHSEKDHIVANRLAMVQRDQLPEDQRRFHDAVKAIRRSPISGPFITLLNSSPDLAARVAHLGCYFHARGLVDESILPMRVRGFVALIGARTLDGVYEWSAWVNWALEAGVPPSTVDAIREQKPLLDLTADDTLVLDFCAQLATGSHHVSDPTFAAVLDRFGVQGTVELAATLGYFALIAFPLNAFEMEMSAEQLAKRKPFKPLTIAPHPGRVAAGGPTAATPEAGTGGALPRVPRIAKHADMTAANQHYFDRVIRTRGRVSGPFAVLLHGPDVADRVAAVGDYLLYHTVLSPAAKAFTWLVVASEFDCEYEWAFAEHAARKAGIQGAAIDAVRRRDSVAAPGDEQALIADFCHQLLRGNHHVADATYYAVVAQFGVPATVQIAATVGYFVMQACVLNAFEVRPEGDPSELIL